MMAVNLGDKPLASFSEPVEMMTDCHRRIEHFLDVLQKVERQSGQGRLSDEGRRALESSLNYFANFAPRHTADEEQSLFPRMRRSDDPAVRAVMADLDGLEHDHRRCEQCHAIVDQMVRQWLDFGRLDEAQRMRLRAALDELARVYAHHIRLEEERVFAVASHVLNSEQLREIGEEMQQRRGLSTLTRLINNAHA
jgi:hemerythrin-like domain-containing protein